MKNQNSEKSTEDSIPKKNYLKLTGTSGIDYYLVKIIGRGTFGVVYEAYGSKQNSNNSIPNTSNTMPFEENKEESNNPQSPIPIYIIYFINYLFIIII